MILPKIHCINLLKTDVEFTPFSSLDYAAPLSHLSCLQSIRIKFGIMRVFWKPVLSRINLALAGARLRPDFLEYWLNWPEEVVPK